MAHTVHKLMPRIAMHTLCSRAHQLLHEVVRKGRLAGGGVIHFHGVPVWVEVAHL